MSSMYRVLVVTLLLGGCAGHVVAPDDCPAGSLKLQGCPPVNAVDDPMIAALYADRTWTKPSELDIDPVEFGRTAEIPIDSARAKFIGSTDDDAVTSLALKLWLIENAEHTIDVVYYIFRDDLSGLAVLGALCEAVRRGVDVRVVVDSLGSASLNRNYLRALESCAIDAGFMRTADGRVTIYPARAQVVIFNAISKIFVKFNRRSHDKLLVVDGHFPDKAAVITGGRNIANDYYSLTDDGAVDPYAYRDAEIFVRGGIGDDDEQATIGVVAEIYYSLLFLFEDNKRLSMTRLRNPEDAYARLRQRFLARLADLKTMPLLAEHYARMPEYASSGFHDTEVLLTHELSNLTDRFVVSDALENTRRNPNSITGTMEALMDQAGETMQVVSPYVFASYFTDDDGNVLLDDAVVVREWLNDHPGADFVVVTNSTLTSDNFFTQAVIDMNVVPRLLLDEEQRDSWLQALDDSEFNPGLVGNDAWTNNVGDPRLLVYETGRSDDTALGGSAAYPKLHAKYVVSGDIGFVGTTNFDYRSQLYNNEMGLFFRSRELADDLRRNTDYLIGLSYRWGTPEWLTMRKALMDSKTQQGGNTRRQRIVYKLLKSTGLIWQF